MNPQNTLRFATALASFRHVGASNVLDLTSDDYEFATSNRLWLATDRSRVRRCVEAMVYGSLDVIGLPRFPAPAEFIAAAIAFYVHPVNVQIACAVFDGAEFSEYIVSGVEKRLSASEIFSLVLQIKADRTASIDYAQDVAERQLKGSL